MFVEALPACVQTCCCAALAVLLKGWRCEATYTSTSRVCWMPFCGDVLVLYVFCFFATGFPCTGLLVA